jgi:hypothetical protein
MALMQVLTVKPRLRAMTLLPSSCSMTNFLLQADMRRAALSAAAPGWHQAGVVV